MALCDCAKRVLSLTVARLGQHQSRGLGERIKVTDRKRTACAYLIDQVWCAADGICRDNRKTARLGLVRDKPPRLMFRGEGKSVCEGIHRGHLGLILEPEETNRSSSLRDGSLHIGTERSIADHHAFDRFIMLRQLGNSTNEVERALYIDKLACKEENSAVRPKSVGLAEGWAVLSCDSRRASEKVCVYKVGRRKHPFRVGAIVEVVLPVVFSNRQVGVEPRYEDPVGYRLRCLAKG